VIMAALEDAAESSMIHKLKAARADLGNVVDASGGPDGDGLELTLDHVSWLHEVAAEHPGAALIVVEALLPGTMPDLGAFRVSGRYL